MAATSQAANLTCSFNGMPPTCTYITSLTPVTQPDENIIVVNAPFSPFLDNIKTTLYIPSAIGVQIQEFPSKLFDFFISIETFEAGNLSTTALKTDAFYNCVNLTSINFSRCNFGTISAGFARTCTKLDTFLIEWSTVGSIDGNAFDGLLNLKRLYMYGTTLIYLPPNLLQPLKALTLLNLDNNKNISFVHSQFFTNLPMLNSVSLYGLSMCYIPNFNFTGTALLPTGGSLQVILYLNPIKAIHPQLLTTLQERKLSGNNMVYVYFNPLDSNITTCVNKNVATNLFYILGYNDFASQNTTLITSTTCYLDFTPEMGLDDWGVCMDPSLTTTTSTTTTTTTTSTTLSTTSTTESSSTIPSTFPPVQCATDKICRYYLDWNNQYTCVIDGAEGTVTSISGTHFLSFTDADLTRLYFTNSHLGKVPNVLFQKFPNLKYLHVRNTGLSVINDQTFNECGNLEFLDASDNEIFRVEETALKNCTKLKIIDLTGNEIDHVSVGLYQNDPALQRVHMRRSNDWILA